MKGNVETAEFVKEDELCNTANFFAWNVDVF